LPETNSHHGEPGGNVSTHGIYLSRIKIEKRLARQLELILYLIGVRKSINDSSPKILQRQICHEVGLLRLEVPLLSLEECCDSSILSLKEQKTESPQRFLPWRRHPLKMQQEKPQKQQKEHQKQQEKHQKLQEKYQKQQEKSLLHLINLLISTLAPYTAHAHSCSTIYDPAFSHWLDEKRYRPLWDKYWTFRTFNSYRDPIFVDTLIKLGHSPHYLILGYDPYLPELLTSHARRLKSLRLIIDYEPKGLLNMLDDLYEEYGLAASCTILPREDEEHPFCQTVIDCPSPSIILDYSEETRLRITNLAAGCLWLDIDGDEEKRRRIDTYFPHTQYMSLGKLCRDGNTCTSDF
jgi:hypothetical protein